MKVAFDISSLGVAYRHPALATGVFRTVDRLARGLLQSASCDVRLVAGPSFSELDDSLAFLESTPGYDGVSASRPRLLDVHVALERRLRQLHHAAARATGAARVAAVSGRWVVENARAALGGTDGPLPAGIRSVDVYHSPHFPLPAHARSVARVLTCHDVIPVRYPEWVTPATAEFMNHVLRSVEPPDHVICPSEWARRDFCACLPRMDPRHVTVVHWAADPVLFYRVTDDGAIEDVRRRYAIPPGPYLLAVGTLEPRKNLRHVVACVAALLRQERAQPVSLVLVGGQGIGLGPLLDDVNHDAVLSGRVVVTGRVSDADLAPLYSGATVFLHLSLAEGFGLPPLEAMQCGVPVIVSRGSSLPEVVGDAAILVDPGDRDGLAQAMFDVCRDSDLRARLSAASVCRATEFSWDRCARETVAVYAAALASRDGSR